MMIPLENLEDMFLNIREKSSWNMSGPMLWGYFFFDPDEAKLKQLADRLSAGGYRVVDVELTDDGDAYRLHAERVEVHSPQSLFERNAVLAELADECDVELYDGMDVGPVTN